MKNICQSCGQKSKKYDTVCTACGKKLMIPNIPTYMGYSVVSILFAPTGIAAFYFSYKAGKYLKSGHLEAAISASKQARLWFLVSVGIAVFYIFLYFSLVWNVAQ